MRKPLLIALVVGMIGTLLLAGGGAGGCSGATGGSEAGNPSRTVIGSLSSPSVAALNLAKDSCSADTVVSIDSFQQSREFPIESDCTFSMELKAERAYAIRFRLADVEAGSLVFQNSPDRFPSPVMEIAEEATEISLGEIVLKNGETLPENEPSTQNDADADGTIDYEDPDDDNDGILDVDEADCDLDGIIDDFDDFMPACAATPSAGPRVLEALPRNGAGISTPEDLVPLDREVRARFSCEVDPMSLSADTFFLTAKDALESALQCELNLSKEGSTISCEPLGLVADTEYQATIRGLRCLDGNAIPETAWVWKTVAAQ